MPRKQRHWQANAGMGNIGRCQSFDDEVGWSNVFGPGAHLDTDRSSSLRASWRRPELDGALE